MDGRSTYLILLVQVIALLFDALHLTFEMFCLDIYLSESATQMRHDRDGEETRCTSLLSPSGSFRQHQAHPQAARFCG